jgi:hypothetical protein
MAGGTVGRADHAERAGDRDVADVMARGVRQRPVLAPAGHPPVHQPGVAGQRLFGADAEPFRDARPVALDQDVGALDQVQERGGALRGLEVQQHGPLVAVGDVVRRIDAQPGAAGPVDPHDVGPQVGQDHGGERPGADAGQLHDPDAGQWARTRLNVHPVPRSL